MDHEGELEKIRNAIAGKGSDRPFSRKIVVLIAGTVSVGLAITFLSFLAIKIGAPPLIIIIFGVLGLMGYDFYDSMRGLMRPSKNGDRNNAADG